MNELLSKSGSIVFVATRSCSWRSSATERRGSTRAGSLPLALPRTSSSNIEPR